MLEDPLQLLIERLEQANARRRGRTRQVGLELKFPVVVRPTGKAPSREAIQGIWRRLEERGWQLLRDAHSDRAVGAKQATGGGTDVVSSATGYCVIELATAPQPCLASLEQRVRAALEPILRHCRDQGLQLLGQGIHPITAPSPALLTAKGRNLFWDDVFDHGDPQVGVYLFTTTAASQAHVDIATEEIADALAVFNGLAAAQIALNANSAVWANRVDPRHKAVHESFWDRWLPDEDRVGMPTARPASPEGYLRRLLDLKPVYVERGGEPIMLPSFASFSEFSASRHPIGVTGEGKQVEIEPRAEDLDLHLTFCWHNARISRYCTLENRVNCQQPPEAMLAVGALSLGLSEGLQEARQLVDRYRWADLRAARREAIQRGLEARVDDQLLSVLCREMLEIASRGLRARGRSEERYLAPLWERLSRARCPADQAASAFRRRGIEGIFERFAINEKFEDRGGDRS